MRQPRKTLLRLESFERRDLPSGIHLLSSPLLSAPLPVAGHIDHIDADVSITHTDHLKASKGHGESLATTTNDRSEKQADAVSAGTAVSSDATSGHATGAGTQDSSVTVASSVGDGNAASGSTTLDESATVSQTSVVSADVQTTEAVRATPSNPTSGSDQGTGGQSQPADTSGADHGTTDSVSGSSGNASSDSSAVPDGTASASAGDQSSSSATSIPTIDNGLKDGVQAGQTSRDKQAETRSGDSGVATQATQIVPQAADHGSLGRGEQTGSLVGSNSASMDVGSRIGAADTANRASNAIHNTAHNAVGDFNLAGGQDASRGRTDDGASTSHAPTGIAALIGKGQAAENSTGSDQTGSAGSAHVRLDEGSLALDSRSTLAAKGRRAASAESLLANVIIGAQTSLPTENPPAPNQDGTAGVDDSPQSVYQPRDASLVSSPLLFDLESLTQEAERLVAGVEELGQDLAGLLGRMHPLQSAIAVGIAATAITAAHRRLKQNQRSVAFACQPGLGGPLMWAES